MSENSAKARVAPNIRDIVELVKTGKLNRAEGFLELREALHSSRQNQVRNHFPNSSVDPDPVGSASADGVSGTSPRSPGKANQPIPQLPSELLMQNVSPLHPSLQVSSSQDQSRDTDERTVHSGGTQASLTHTGRRLLINKLLEKKKLQNESSQPASPALSHSHPVVLDQVYDSASERGGGTSTEPLAPPRSAFSPSSEHRGRAGVVVGTGYKEEDSISLISQSTEPPAMGGRGRRMNQLQHTPIKSYAASRRLRSRSADDRGGARSGQLLDTSLSAKVSQAGAAVEQEMYKECTFKPSIFPVPKEFVVDKETPFYARVTQWKTNKDKEGFKRRLSQEDIEYADCTFKPRINRNSSIAARSSLPNSPNSSMDVGERLYQHNEDSVALKAKLIEDELQKEKEEEARACTFKPNLYSNKFTDIGPKYLLDDKSSGGGKNKSAVKDPTLKECTFTPKVNNLRPGMTTAKAYVGTNVTERLSRIPPPHPSPGAASTASVLSAASTSKSFDLTYGGDRAVQDMSSFMGSFKSKSGKPFPGLAGTGTISTGTGGGGAGGGAGAASAAGNASNSNSFQTPVQLVGGRTLSFSTQRASSAPKERLPGMSNQNQSSVTESLSAEDREARKKQFEQFISRQKQTQLRKMRHMDEGRQAETPTFEPELCRHSLEIVKEAVHGDFLNRMERFVLKKEDADVRRRSVGQSECTFQPAILPKSEKLRSKSAMELSQGDLVRMKNSLSQLRSRKAQEDAQIHTFQPEISKKAAKGSKSVLKISENPSSHLVWIHNKKAKKEAMRREALLVKEQQEKAECTFTPTLVECPEFISKMAKSMDVIKKARGSSVTSQPTGKPLWR